jgi:hypothetical protein
LARRFFIGKCVIWNRLLPRVVPVKAGEDTHVLSLGNMLVLVPHFLFVFEADNIPPAYLTKRQCSTQGEFHLVIEYKEVINSHETLQTT